MTEEFEKWAQSKSHDVAHSKHHDNRYYSMITQNLWEAWQARQPEIDALNEEHKKLKAAAESAMKIFGWIMHGDDMSFVKDDAHQFEIDALKAKTTKMLTETAEKVEIIPFYDEELKKAAEATLRLIDERFFTHLSVFTEDREIVENLRAVLEKIKATEEKK